MPRGRNGAGIKVKPRRIEVAMPVGRKAMPIGRRAMPIGKKASGKGATLDARFTRLLELRGEASARQSSAREQLLAKKRGQKAPAVPTSVQASLPQKLTPRHLFWSM